MPALETAVLEDRKHVNDHFWNFAVVCLGGRRGMIFANYPKRERATMQFQCSNRVGVGHEATAAVSLISSPCMEFSVD